MPTRGNAAHQQVVTMHPVDALANGTGTDFTLTTDSASVAVLLSVGAIASGSIDVRLLHGAVGSPTTRVPDTDLEFTAGTGTLAITTNATDTTLDSSNDSGSIVIGYHGDQPELRLELLNASTPVGEYSAVVIEGHARRLGGTP